MKRFGIIMILLACPLMTLGQAPQPGGSHGNTQTNPTNPPYNPAVPAASAPVYAGGGYGYGYGGGQTAQGAALQGMSQVISAAGEYNLATSAAAVNMTQADSNQLRNDVQGVQTFWQMRDIGAAERAQERGPRPTTEEFARRARAGLPAPLSASQIDPVTGVLYWPGPLQDASYQTQKSAIEQCTAKWVKYGGLDYTSQTQVRDNVESMFTSLKAQIQSIPSQDYVMCRSFLTSLLYATTRTTL
jgi:hypothetical protein